MKFLKTNYQKTNFMKNEKRIERLKELVNDPAFSKPISYLNKEYTGTLTLVTRIKIYN